MNNFRPLSPDFTADDLWTADPASVANWEKLHTGGGVTIVKRDPNGKESARYPGTVTSDPAIGPWRTLTATWTMPDVTQGGLTIATGDTLHELFSCEHPFNAFGVMSPAGEFKGWYANVTWPAFLQESPDGLVLTWQDLVLDIIVLPSGQIVHLDDDELADSRIPHDFPQLANAIIAVRDHLTTLAPASLPPFTVQFQSKQSKHFRQT
ncbi:MAG: DUF402 domain-containing protein [Rhodococcus sp. (in: high G+C Gram-positive bacteria)]